MLAAHTCRLYVRFKCALPLQLVQECAGYKAPDGFAFMLSISVAWRLVARFKPDWAVHLLQHCPLHRADWVLVKVSLRPYSKLFSACHFLARNMLLFVCSSLTGAIAW